MRPWLIGHRGASHQAPENTAAAFGLAFAEGADGIEADFRLTRDGTIVCLHDESTGRTAGRDLPVAQATYDELALLDVGGWKGGRFLGARIPTLRQVLDLLPSDGILFIELKSGREIVPALREELALSSVDPERIRILSFDSMLIREVKGTLPAYRACWLTDFRSRADRRTTCHEVLATLRDCAADGLAGRARTLVDLPFVERLREEGHEIHLWTVDSAAEAARLYALQVDSIITNRPGFLRRVLSRGEGTDRELREL